MNRMQTISPMQRIFSRFTSAPSPNQETAQTNPSQLVQMSTYGCSEDQLQANFDEYLTGAKNGDLQSALQCGEALLKGVGVTQNIQVARDYFIEITDASSLFNSTANRIKGQAWAHLAKLKEDYPELMLRNNLDAHQCYRKAAEHKNPIGLIWQGLNEYDRYLHCCDTTDGTVNSSPFETRAKQNFELAFKEGNVDARFCLAVIAETDTALIDSGYGQFGHGEGIVPRAQLYIASPDSYKETELADLAENGHFGANLILGKHCLYLARANLDNAFSDEAARHFSYADSSKDRHAWVYVGRAYEAHAKLHPTATDQKRQELLRIALACYKKASWKNSHLAFKALGIFYKETNPNLAKEYFEQAKYLGSIGADDELMELNKIPTDTHTLDDMNSDQWERRELMIRNMEDNKPPRYKETSPEYSLLDLPANQS